MHYSPAPFSQLRMCLLANGYRFGTNGARNASQITCNDQGSIRTWL